MSSRLRPLTGWISETLLGLFVMGLLIAIWMPARGEANSLEGLNTTTVKQHAASGTTSVLASKGSNPADNIALKDELQSRATFVSFALLGNPSTPLPPSFDICVQDDSSSNTLLFNSTTGQYILCCSNGFTLSGVGVVSKQSNVITLQQGPGETDRRIAAKVDIITKRGTAMVQYSPGQTKWSIIDRNITNNSCICSGPV